MPFAAIVRRIRSFSLSIGQLTFASFMVLLAMIVMTSVASVVSIRHIDATFAELQRLQSLGDLAEEIDRRLKELRLAGGFLVEQSLEKTPAGAGARSAGYDRRRHCPAAELRRGDRARHCLDCAPRG